MGMGVGIGPSIVMGETNAPVKFKYFVDQTSGDDSKSGLSESLAWKTVSKVNGFAFSPGDSIGFKRGETWGEVLTPTASGDSTHLIYFGAYGVGLNPILDGGGVRSNGIATTEDWLSFNELTIDSATSNGIFFNFGNTDCFLTNIIVTNTTAGNGMLIRGNNCAISNCDVSGSSNFGFSIGAGTNHKILNCTSHGNTKTGLFISADGALVDGGEYYENGDSGGSSQGDGVNVFSADDVIVRNVVSRNNFGNGISAIFDTGDVVNNLLVEDCLSYSNDMEAFSLASGIRMDTNTEFSIIRNNISRDNQSGGLVFEDGCNNCTASGNTLTGNARGMSLSNNSLLNQVVEDNIMSNNTEHGLQIVSSGSGSAVINRNTFNDNTEYGIHWDSDGTYTLGTGDDVNSFSGNGSGETFGF